MISLQHPAVVDFFGESHLPGHPHILTWTTEHSQSSYGLGVLLLDERMGLGEILDGLTFARLSAQEGQYILCDTDEERAQCASALAEGAFPAGLDIRVRQVIRGDE